MASPYSINMGQEDASFLDQLGSMIQHSLIHIDIEIRRVSSLNIETTLETFNQSFAGRRDMFLFEENVRGIMCSLPELIEILFETSLDDEFPELIDESLTCSVNFKPASKSSIEALGKVKY
ncbi:hypothetical protein V6N13_077291 [Hibiscus sabdariffa]|uniref:Uncharacterized protein n=1 Tax=Hibiscus sabdariffa TaxID=183260 RepID=A0ABR2CNF1_9ROSI